MKKTIVMAFAALAVLAACTDKQEKRGSIVVYYSQTGATEKVAQLIAEKTGADLLRIEAESPYDGDFDATIARCKEEMEAGTLPALQALEKDAASYDTIYLGFPIWFGVAAPPMKTYAKEISLEGKVVIPFCTFGSGGLETGVADLKKDLPGATFLEGYGVRNARLGKANDEIDRWLTEIGIKAGEVEKWPDFGEQTAVSEEVQAIYDAACGDYPMPLGTPVSVRSRSITGGMEYDFENKSTGRDGQEMTSHIYVFSLDGEKPEFTKAVR